MFHSYQIKTPKASILCVLVGLVVLGLVGWNVSLQRRLSGSGADGESSRLKRSADDSRRNQHLLGQSGGAMFVRWGRRACPDDDSELVYSGIVGASYYSNTGGSADLVCLAREPQYAKFTDNLEGTAKIMGLEFGGDQEGLFDTTHLPSGKVMDNDVVCAVCRSKTRTSQVMIPGRKECYPGWRMEYWGYLMTGHWSHKAQLSWTCVDNAPEADQKGARNDRAASGRIYVAQGVCGSLPCPNYVNGRELTCVVCTK